MEKFFSPFPGVREFISKTHFECYKNLRVETILGRPRRLPTIIADGPAAAEARRQAVNSIIQGSAADITNMAMISCENDERLKELDAQLLLQIHDELIFEVPEENAEEAAGIIKEIMEGVVELKVPLVADPGIAYTWADAKD